MLSIDHRFTNYVVAVILICICTQSVFSQQWNNVANGTEGLVYELYADSKDSILYMSGAFDYEEEQFTDRIKYWDGSGFHRIDSGGTNGAIRDILEYNGDLIFSGHYGPEGDVVMGWNGSQWYHLPSYQDQILGYLVETLAKYQNKLYAFSPLPLSVDTLGTRAFIYDGTRWTDFHGMENNSYTTYCNTVHKGKLYVGGVGIRFDTVNYGNAFVYDGTGIQSVAINQDPCVIYILEVYRDTLYAGTKCGTIYKLDSNSWVPVIQTDDRIIAMKSHGGRLYFGGLFTTATLLSDSSTISVSNIAYYDNQAIYKMGEGTNDYVVTLESYQGSIYAGGEFTEAGGMNAAYIARWGEPLGIEESKGPGRIKIYPNPAGNYIYFELPASGGSQEMTVTLYNEVGAIMLRKQLPSGGTEGLDVSRLRPGLYILEMEKPESGEMFYGRFVRK